MLAGRNGLGEAGKDGAMSTDHPHGGSPRCGARSQAAHADSLQLPFADGTVSSLLEPGDLVMAPSLNAGTRTREHELTQATDMPIDRDRERPDRRRSRALSRTPRRAGERRPWRVALWLCAGLGVLVSLTMAVRDHPQGVVYDRLLVSLAAHHQYSVLRRIAVAVSNAASLPALSIGVVLFAAVFVLERRGLAPGLAMGIAVWGTYLLYRLEKLLVHRPRPWLFDVGANPAGSAFPSGHEAQAVAFYGMLAILLGLGRSRQVKCLLWSAAVGVVLLIGVARMYLGAHWFTDILAGVALGTSVVSATLLFGMADVGLEHRREPGPDLIRASWLRRLMRGDAAAWRPPDEHDIEIRLPKSRVGNREHGTLSEVGAHPRSRPVGAFAGPVVSTRAPGTERPAKTVVESGDRAIDEARGATGVRE
jgi:membrane-associated phospholipid phosphatase